MLEKKLRHRSDYSNSTAEKCMQVFNTIALKMVKVSKLAQRKLIPHRSIIGLGAFRKIKYFGDIPRQLLCI